MHICAKYPMMINLKKFSKTSFEKYKRIVQKLQRAVILIENFFKMKINSNLIA